VEGEKQFLDSFFYFLGLITRPIEVDYYLDKLSKKLKRAKSIIEAEFTKFKSQKTNYTKEKYVEDTKIEFSREAHFVGFLISNWGFFENMIKKQREKVLNLFQEELPLKILIKKIDNELFTKEEEQRLLGWELYGNNLNERDDKEFLEKEFKSFAKYLKEAKLKIDRIKVAKSILLKK
jgi:hypothetical protein